MGYAKMLNQERGDLVENPLGIGDLVRLKSGGPVMVLMKEPQGDVGTVQVVWHDKVGQDHQGEFKPQLLTRARRWYQR